MKTIIKQLTTTAIIMTAVVTIAIYGCKKVDNNSQAAAGKALLYIDPSAYGGHKFGIGGFNQNFGCSVYNSSFIKPDLQEVMYSTDGGAHFYPFT